MKFTRSLQAWRRSRRTFNELSRLTARELDDLGICRGDIAHISRTSAHAAR